MRRGIRADAGIDCDCSGALNQDPEAADALIAETLEDIRSSAPDHEGGQIRYPGESTIKRRKENIELGIPVKEEIWNSICRM